MSGTGDSSNVVIVLPDEDERPLLIDRVLLPYFGDNRYYAEEGPAGIIAVADFNIDAIPGDGDVNEAVPEIGGTSAEKERSPAFLDVDEVHFDRGIESGDGGRVAGRIFTTGGISHNEVGEG